MKKAFFVFWSLLCAVCLYCASPTFKKAEDAYDNNKPAEARPLLEAVIAEDPTNELAYLHLGTVYFQLGDLNKAIAVYKRGLNIASQYRELFSKNIGDCFFKQVQFTFAEQSYTDAITANPQYPSAYRERANARFKLQKYDGVVEDFTVFLKLKPDDAQRPMIEELLRRLAKVKEASLAQQKDEEARQKALMNDVMSSLDNASEDAKNLSVESLQFKHDNEDVDIKD